MVICEQDERPAEPERRRSYGEGGPVFLPPRKLSPLARTLLATPSPLEVERVTAYDERWYLGRPHEA